MPSIRVGLGTDLNIKGGNTGIGTITPTARLEVVGGIVAERASSGGISTFKEYQGFNQTLVAIPHDTLIDNGECGPFSSLSGEIKITGETTVSSGSTVEVGKTKTLTITDKFAVPLGETNNRDAAPEAGTTRFNQDFGTLEFFDGVNWKTVNSYARYHGGGAGRAIYGGTSNNPYYQVLHYVNIHTTGNSIDFGSLLVRRYGTTGSCSSNTRALVAGGYNDGTLDTIEYFTMASNAQAIDFGNLALAEYCMLSCSSSTRGLFTGSYNPGSSSANARQIQYVEIATLGNALDFGDMSDVTRFGGAGLSSPTRGIFAGGRAKNNTGPYPANAATHEIDFVSIASKGNSTTFGDMTFNGGYCGGMSNTTRGIIGGSRDPATVNNIDMITIASTGNAVHFGDLTVARAGSQTGSTQTRGIFIGGSPTADTRKTIDYITISSSGNAIDFGESGFEVDVGASVSDSHGGLGGF